MNFTGSNLGNGKPGIQPLLLGNTVGTNERSVNRKHLTKAFGNMYNTGLQDSPLLYNRNVLGPFRTAFNGGDVVTNKISETNKKYGIATNQINGNNVSRIKGSVDGTNNRGIASYSGNTKFIYDGSDYTKFKKLMAINKNYNDITFGGANNFQTQSALKKVRS